MATDWECWETTVLMERADWRSQLSLLDRSARLSILSEAKRVRCVEWHHSGHYCTWAWDAVSQTQPPTSDYKGKRASDEAVKMTEVAAERHPLNWSRDAGRHVRLPAAQCAPALKASAVLGRTTRLQPIYPRVYQ